MNTRKTCRAFFSNLFEFRYFVGERHLAVRRLPLVAPLPGAVRLHSAVAVLARASGVDLAGSAADLGNNIGNLIVCYSTGSCETTW